MLIRDTLGFTGQGVRGELADDNVPSRTWTSRAKPVIFHTSVAGPTDHGTNMYGCIFGTGTGDPAGDGMMPGAGDLCGHRAGGGRSLQPDAGPAGGPLLCVLPVELLGGTQTTQYTTRSAEMDDILFDKNIFITNSMSNLGNQQCRPEAWAKNIMSVGAILHRDTLTTADDCWCGLGSIGPASDGRIKPEVAELRRQHLLDV